MGAKDADCYVFIVFYHILDFFSLYHEVSIGFLVLYLLGEEFWLFLGCNYCEHIMCYLIPVMLLLNHYIYIVEFLFCL